MENGNTLTNLNESRYNGLPGGSDKMTMVYKVPPYSHPNKRPIQSVGGTSSQGNTVTMMEGRGQHMSGTVPSVLQQTSPRQNNIPQIHPQHTLYSGSPNKVPQAQKMVLQLQRDPKTGNLMMMNNPGMRPQAVIQMENQVGPGQQVANHGYHPGRHLHHQLQLKHLPQQGAGPGVTQLTHPPATQQHPPRHQIIQPRPPQPYQPSQPSQPRPQQSYQPTYENMTYTRTYPQTNQQSYQYNYQSLRPVTRYVTPAPGPQYQQMMVQNNMRAGTQPQTVPPAQVMTSQPRYNQNHVLSTSRAVTTERLSHFDYGEQDDMPNNRPGFPRTSSYQQVIENEDKSTLRVSHAGPVPKYNPVFVGPQPAQIIGQLRPTQTFVSQPNIISTQTSHQFRASTQTSPQFRLASAQQQPYVVRNQIRNSVPLQTSGQPSRAPNVVASPAQSSSADYSTTRPVILTAQQAGQTFQSSPVVVQINGGKSIRGSIVSLNNPPQQPPKQITPTTSTHVYFTIPQGNSAAKFIKTPNGHLRPVNGVAIQNSLSQSKMYTVRYVNPKNEDGKTKQFTIYSPIAPSNNNVKIANPANSKPSEKIILPKGTTHSTQETNRKRKLTPTKGAGASHQPSKLTRLEPKPAQNAVSSQHNELIQRVNKSLEGDREAVLRPDCNTPFESFPDAFRKLMKYHIFFEPDTKDSYIKRVDKLHDEISLKLKKRKDNMYKKYYSRIVEDAARPMRKHGECIFAYGFVEQRLLDEKEELQKLKDDVRRAKAAKAREEQRATENVSPNLGGEFD